MSVATNGSRNGRGGQASCCNVAIEPMYTNPNFRQPRTARRYGPLALVVALAFSAGTGAQTMYRCQDAGKTVYSDKPCSTGVEVKRLGPNGGLTPEDMAKSRARPSPERVRDIEQQRLAQGAAKPASKAAPVGDAAANAAAKQQPPKPSASPASRN